MSERVSAPGNNQDGSIEKFFSLHGGRADRWRALHTVARRWVKDSNQAELVKALYDELGIFEGFFAYPGKNLISALGDRIAGGQAAATASLAQRISESLLDRSYKEDPGDWQSAETAAETPPNINTTTLAHGQAHRPYFEMLVVAPGAAARSEFIVEQMRRLRRPEDAFVYEVVPVPSFEDAICAAILNPAIAAVTLYEGFDYETESNAPVLRQVLATAGFDAERIDHDDLPMTLAAALKRLRPELDLYLLSDRRVERIAGDPRAANFRRVLYSVEELLELHLCVQEGIADRFRTPFFDNLKKYALRPISTFHARPSRAASRCSNRTGSETWANSTG